MVAYTNHDFLAYPSDFITELTTQVISDFRGTTTILVRLFPASQAHCQDMYYETETEIQNCQTAFH